MYVGQKKELLQLISFIYLLLGIHINLAFAQSILELGYRNNFGSLSKSSSEIGISPRCKGRNISWGTLLVGTDLAEKRLQQLIQGIPLKERHKYLAKCSVVDTGFDLSQSKQLSTNLFQVDRGYEDAGEPGEDPDGHGTAVVGNIASKVTGVTSFVDLTSYRITTGAEGEVYPNDFTKSITKACAENEVVNVSWGNIFEEQGLFSFKDDSWFKEIQDSNCLIIKSAGNSGFKANGRELPTLEEPVLFVEAANYFGLLANFSTTGQVRAPGHNSFGLVSQTSITEEQKKESCFYEGAYYQEFSGTSFSSPLTAGVACQIISALKILGIFPNDRTKRNSLIKSLLLASENKMQELGFVPMINAAIAIKMVELLEKEGISPISADRYLHLFNNKTQVECNQKAIFCSRNQNNFFDCLDQQRERLYFCGAKNLEFAENIYQNLDELKEFELSLQAMRFIPKSSSLRQKALQEIENLWNKWLKQAKELDEEILFVGDNMYYLYDENEHEAAIDLIELAYGAGFDEAVNSDKLIPLIKFSQRIITSDMITKIYNSVDASDSRKISRLNRFLQAFAFLKAKDFQLLFKEITKNKLGAEINHYSLEDESVHRLIYFLYINSESFPSEIKAAVSKAHLDLATFWLWNNRYVYKRILNGEKITIGDFKKEIEDSYAERIAEIQFSKLIDIYPQADVGKYTLWRFFQSALEDEHKLIPLEEKFLIAKKILKKPNFEFIRYEDTDAFLMPLVEFMLDLNETQRQDIREIILEYRKTLAVDSYAIDKYECPKCAQVFWDEPTKDFALKFYANNLTNAKLINDSSSINFIDEIRIAYDNYNFLLSQGHSKSALDKILKKHAKNILQNLEHTNRKKVYGAINSIRSWLYFIHEKVPYFDDEKLGYQIWRDTGTHPVRSVFLEHRSYIQKKLKKHLSYEHQIKDIMKELDQSFSD